MAAAYPFTELSFVGMKVTGQFMSSTNFGMAGVPLKTMPVKSSSCMSLVAVDTTWAHNKVLPSVPAKAIFFMGFFRIAVSNKR